MTRMIENNKRELKNKDVFMLVVQPTTKKERRKQFYVRGQSELITSLSPSNLLLFPQRNNIANPTTIVSVLFSVSLSLSPPFMCPLSLSPPFMCPFSPSSS